MSLAVSLENDPLAGPVNMTFSRKVRVPSRPQQEKSFIQMYMGLFLFKAGKLAFQVRKMEKEPANTVGLGRTWL